MFDYNPCSTSIDTHAKFSEDDGTSIADVLPEPD
jgi:hypothetical protein